MAITRAAGFPINNQTSPTSVAATWVTVGDLAVLSISAAIGTAQTINTVSSTKATGWTKIVTASDTTDGFNVSIFAGTITATGADTMTVTWTGGTPGAGAFEVVVDELHSGLGATNVWTISGNSGSLRDTTDTKFPSLTSGTATLQAYWGYQNFTGSGTATGTAGFTFTVTGIGNIICFDGGLATSTVFQPNATGGPTTFSGAGIVSVALPAAAGTPPVHVFHRFPLRRRGASLFLKGPVNPVPVPRIRIFHRFPPKLRGISKFLKGPITPVPQVPVTVVATHRRRRGVSLFLRGPVNPVPEPNVTVIATHRRRRGFVQLLQGIPSTPTTPVPPVTVIATHQRRRGVSKVLSGPVEIVPGYSAWYDASQITGQADNTALSAWPDLSGNGFNLSQVTGVSQPTYYSSTPGRTVNGLPAVWFNGVGTFMATAAFGALAQPSTVFVVSQSSVTTGTHYTFSGNSVNDQQIVMLSGTFNAAAPTQLSGPPVDANLHVFTAVYNGASGSISVDATTVSGAVGANSIDAIRLGSNRVGFSFWQGPICEVIYYNSLLSSTQTATVQAYLRNKWFAPPVTSAPVPAVAVVTPTHTKRRGLSRFLRGTTPAPAIPLPAVTVVTPTHTRRRGITQFLRGPINPVPVPPVVVQSTHQRRRGLIQYLRGPTTTTVVTVPVPPVTVVTPTHTRRRGIAKYLRGPVNPVAVPPITVQATHQRRLGRLIYRRGTTPVVFTPVPPVTVVTPTHTKRRGITKFLKGPINPVPVPKVTVVATHARRRGLVQYLRGLVGAPPPPPVIPTPTEFTARPPAPYWTAGDSRLWWAPGDPSSSRWEPGEPLVGWSASQALLEATDADNATPDWQTGEPRS